MLNRLVPPTVLALLISELTILISAFVIPAYFLLPIDPMVWFLYEDGFLRIGLLVSSLVLGFYFQDLYSDLRVTSRFTLVQQVCMVIGIGFLFQALISYFSPALQLPRWIMMFGSLGLLLILPVWRMFYASLVMQAFTGEKVLFLGASDLSRRIAQRIAERPELGWRVVGFVADPAETESLTEGEVVAPLAEFHAGVQRIRPDRVVVGLTERRQRMPVHDLLDLNFSGVIVEEAATTFERVFQRVCIPELRPSQLIFSNELGPRPFILTVQNLYSFILALIGVIVALPIMLIVAVLVRLTSKGPAFYSQKRVGRHGEVFTLYKFRSMRVDAEAKSGAVWAQRHDPRITRFGKFLRRSRLDELPQLFNVLRGEMSLVGPRPERPEFVATLSQQIPFYRQRHFVKPGLTGWAQINHKYGDTIQDTITKLEYDLYYIKNLSPMLDLYTIFNTVKVMLLSRGAQ
ncbi:MAG: sugar transferase [Bryobacterales bacterium]|nr:sugar transferase [Bryobacterales bacterium]